jgi:hypothetical protein
MSLDEAEMVAILEEIARSGKSHGARIDAIKQLRAMREDQAAAPTDKPVDPHGALYDVANPGRVRRPA